MENFRALTDEEKAKRGVNIRANSINLWIGASSPYVYASCKDPMDLQARALCQQINEEPHSYMDAFYVMKDAGYID